jgi:enoyl-CoA hydratase
MQGPTRLSMSKPVIAAIEGHAVAGGLELALWCDVRVASTSAVFGVYCRRFGVPLIDGGTVRLPRLIGESRAMDMILSGRPVDAEEGLQFGLVNRLVPNGTALEAAIAYATDLTSFPQLCMRTDMASVKRQWALGEQEALLSEARAGERAVRESPAGATRFADGTGRGGSFDK